MMTATHDEASRLKTLTITETAERLGVCYSTARLAIRRGDIPSIRLGNMLRVPEALLARKLGVVA